MKLPLQPNTRFTRAIDVTGGGIDQRLEQSSGIVNGMVLPGENGELYTTHRPKYYIALAAGGSGEGRGAYNWPGHGTYFARGDTVYKGNYSGAVTGPTIPTIPNTKVYFAEVGEYLCIIVENAGYYINSATDTVMTAITDVDFPPNQTPAISLAGGAASYKGRLYVLDENGTIWNSALEDPTAWNGGDNITAEYRPDGGVYIGNYKNEIIVFGQNTIEFFYHAGNPTNSPLSVRQDIFYEVGSVSPESIANDRDVIYFKGTSAVSGVGLYVIDNYSLGLISPPDFSFNLAYRNTSIKYYGAVTSSFGKSLYMITIHLSPNVDSTYVYDSQTKLIYEWDLSDLSLAAFEVIDWTNPTETASYISTGFLRTGELIYEFISLSDDSVSPNVDPVGFVITTDIQNFGSRKQKFMNNVALDAYVSHAEIEQTSQTAQLRFYDEGEIDSTGLPTHDIELLDRHVAGAGLSNVLARAGSFRNRRVEVTVPNSTDKTRVEVYALDFDIREGL